MTVDSLMTKCQDFDINLVDHLGSRRVDTGQTIENNKAQDGSHRSLRKRFFQHLLKRFEAVI